MQSVHAFLTAFIARWEGGLSLDPTDHGNWWNGKLVGSKYGVTGAALARHRGISNITAQDISNLQLSEAADVAQGQFYDHTGIDNLLWNRVTASVTDLGYNAGPKAAITHLQTLLGVSPDGSISAGGETAKAFEHASLDEAGFAVRWAKARSDFYNDLVKKHPEDAKYIHGWLNRTAYYTPSGSDGWWVKVEL